MMSDNPEQNPFMNITVTGLLGWVFIGLILSTAVFLVMLLSTNIERSVLESVLFLFVAMWPMIWVRKRFRDNNLSLVGTIKVHNHSIQYYSLPFIAISLIIVSVGSFGVLWYPISYIAPNVLNYLFSDNWLYENGEVINTLAAILKVLGIVFVVPVVEEICFRGIVLHRWALKWGLKKGILYSSLLFGVLHSDIVGGFIYGCVMSIVYIHTRTLFIPILLHFLNNAAACSAEAVDVLINGVPKFTIAEFQSGMWIGLCCAIYAVAWTFCFFKRKWPADNVSLPLFPIPPP